MSDEFTRVAKAGFRWRERAERAEARLAQAEQNSTDLRAVWKATERELAEERARLCEVEQERDEAIRLNEYEVLLRERDEAINDALNAKVRLRVADALKREYEEALEAYSAFDDVIAVLMDARRVECARLEAARAVLAASGERNHTAEAPDERRSP